MLIGVGCLTVPSLLLVVNVEMEIVLPGDMTVIESHDIALDLQHKIESLDDVERAFVHVSSPSISSGFHRINWSISAFRLIINVVMDWSTKLKENLSNHQRNHQRLQLLVLRFVQDSTMAQALLILTAMR